MNNLNQKNIDCLLNIFNSWNLDYIFWDSDGLRFCVGGNDDKADSQSVIAKDAGVDLRAVNGLKKKGLILDVVHDDYSLQFKFSYDCNVPISAFLDDDGDLDDDFPFGSIQYVCSNFSDADKYSDISASSRFQDWLADGSDVSVNIFDLFGFKANKVDYPYYSNHIGMNY